MKKIFTIFLFTLLLFQYVNAAELIPRWCDILFDKSVWNISMIRSYSSSDWKTKIIIDYTEKLKSGITKVAFGWKMTTYSNVYGEPIFMNDWKDWAFLAINWNNDYKVVFVKNNTETIIWEKIATTYDGRPLYYSNGANMIYIIEKIDGTKKLYLNDTELSVDLSKYTLLDWLTISANGKSTAFITTIDKWSYGESFVVKDGIENEHFAHIDNITLSPDGTRMIYGATTLHDHNHVTVVDWIIQQKVKCVGNIYFSQNSKSYICEWQNLKTGDINVIKDGIDISNGKYWEIRNVEYLPGTSFYMFIANMKNGKNTQTVLVKDGKIIKNLDVSKESDIHAYQLNDNKNIVYVATRLGKNSYNVVSVKWKDIVRLPFGWYSYPQYLIDDFSITNRNTGKDFILKFRKETTHWTFKQWIMTCKNIK